MATRMRAVLIKNEKGPIENLYLGSVPKPTPQTGEVLVKVGFIDVLAILSSLKINV